MRIGLASDTHGSVDPLEKALDVFATGRELVLTADAPPGPRVGAHGATSGRPGGKVSVRG